MMITEKITNLEQTVMQRLKWAAGANPLVQDVLIKFERRQKERKNEIDVRTKRTSSCSSRSPSNYLE